MWVGSNPLEALGEIADVAEVVDAQNRVEGSNHDSGRQWVQPRHKVWGVASPCKVRFLAISNKIGKNDRVPVVRIGKGVWQNRSIRTYLIVG